MFRRLRLSGKQLPRTMAQQANLHVIGLSAEGIPTHASSYIDLCETRRKVCIRTHCFYLNQTLDKRKSDIDIVLRSWVKQIANALVRHISCLSTERYER